MPFSFALGKYFKQHNYGKNKTVRGMSLPDPIIALGNWYSCLATPSMNVAASFTLGNVVPN
jgi:hypothetical protein